MTAVDDVVSIVPSKQTRRLIDPFLAHSESITNDEVNDVGRPMAFIADASSSKSSSSSRASTHTFTLIVQTDQSSRYSARGSFQGLRACPLSVPLVLSLPFHPYWTSTNGYH